VYAYLPAEKVIRIRDGSKMQDLQYWYEGAKISPLADGQAARDPEAGRSRLEQTTETDPNTGKEARSSSLQPPAVQRLLPSRRGHGEQVDSESQALEESDAGRQTDVRRAAVHLQSRAACGFLRTQGTPEVTVLTQEAEEQNEALFHRAESLFHKEKKYRRPWRSTGRSNNAYPHLRIAQQL